MIISVDFYISRFALGRPYMSVARELPLISKPSRWNQNQPAKHAQSRFPKTRKNAAVQNYM